MYLELLLAMITGVKAKHTASHNYFLTQILYLVISLIFIINIKVDRIYFI